VDLTGNPFVDTGLMVLTALAEKDHVSSVSFADVRRIFGNGRQLARDNQRLKCFTMVFGTNGPLTQPAYKKSKKNEEVYLSIIQRVLDLAEQEGHSGSRCDLTGTRTNFDFQTVCAESLREVGLPVPEKKWLGRDWVPLGGSLGNDAQSLPSASRPLHVSALALFALQYLPLGIFLFKGKLTCYQSTANGLTQVLVNEVVGQNQNRINLGETEILGKGGGTRILLDFLADHFESLKDVTRSDALPPNTELLLWLFSNSGTGAECAVEHVPEPALAFIYEVMSKGFGSEIRELLVNDPKDSRSQLFECIRSARDYPGLYPYKKRPGASVEFYELYQCAACGAAPASLEVARKLARLVVESERKRLNDVRKPDFLRSAIGRNFIRKVMTENLTDGEYDALFPSQHHPIRVESSGWQYLRYYLSRQEDDSRPISTVSTPMRTTHPKIIQLAEAYVRDKDPKKIKNLLDRMAHIKVGIRWLQDVFCRLAEEHEDWNLGTWDEFVCDEDGKVIAYELFFQLRLHLANLYREATSQQEGKVA
jgi:hypothetical protein